MARQIANKAVRTITVRVKFKIPVNGIRERMYAYIRKVTAKTTAGITFPA